MGILAAEELRWISLAQPAMKSTDWRAPPISAGLDLNIEFEPSFGRKSRWHVFADWGSEHLRPQ